MKLKWEQKAFGIGLAVLITLMFISSQWQNYQEGVAKEERAAARDVAAKAAVIRDAESLKALKDKFAAERESMMSEMRLGLAKKYYFTGLQHGVNFKSVADPDFLQLAQQVVDADRQETEAAKAKVAQQKSNDDQRTSRALTFARLIRKGAHDPASVEFDKVFLMNGSQAICYEYRGRNGFNALRKANALINNKGEIKTESSPGFATAWNRECAGKNGDDLTAAANMYK